MTKSEKMIFTFHVIRDMEQELAGNLDHTDATYTRDQMDSYFKDRKALIRVEELLNDQAEILQLAGD